MVCGHQSPQKDCLFSYWIDLRFQTYLALSPEETICIYMQTGVANGCAKVAGKLLVHVLLVKGMQS